MDQLKNYQNKLFPFAYNILGSVDDALDAVQDVMVNYQNISDRDLENETAYLVKSVVNKAINMKTRRKKTVPALWLPEPVATDFADRDVRKEEIISYSLLVLLEYLNPKERAVFILKEAFDYSHEEIATTLSIEIEHSRKLLSRAHNKLHTNRQNFKSDYSDSKSMLEDYIELIKSGDVKGLENKLAHEISVFADGGGKVKVVRELTEGTAPVLDLIFFLYERYHRHYTFRYQYVNHQPAILFFEDGTIINCQVFETDSDGKIRSIYSVVDPDKLKRLQKV